MEKQSELLSNQEEPRGRIELRISPSVIKRMALYLNTLEKMGKKHEGSFFISSKSIAEHSGVKAVQVRKDFSRFGTFGRPGVGYDAHNLKQQIIKILNLTKNVGIAFIGIGRLGSALLRYYNQRFHGREHGYYEPRALFDNDPEVVGRQLEGLEILPIDTLAETAAEKNIEIAVLTVPAENAQQVAQICVETGIQAILNFAPVVLNLPREIKVQNVDLSAELEHLGFYLH